MNDIPRRSDTWIQWALLLIAVIGALWTLAGRISRVEQQLDDQRGVMQDQSNRMQTLEHEMQSLAARRAGQ